MFAHVLHVILMLSQVQKLQGQRKGHQPREVEFLGFPIIKRKGGTRSRGHWWMESGRAHRVSWARGPVTSASQLLPGLKLGQVLPCYLVLQDKLGTHLLKCEISCFLKVGN